MAKASRIQDRGFWWACGDCRSRNYTSVKNRRNDPERMKIKKFCPRCGHHTEHRETSVNARARG